MIGIYVLYLSHGLAPWRQPVGKSCSFLLFPLASLGTVKVLEKCLLSESMKAHGF